MTRTTRVVPAVALFAAAAVAACHKKPAETAPEPVATVDSTAIRRAIQDSLDRLAAAKAARERAIADSIARAQAALSGQQQALRATLTQTVYFDYDKDELRDETRSALDAKAPILIANSSVTIRVNGHTDERGTAEYNLALGQRRAAAVKRYLVSRGVADGRIETRSFGEEQPAEQGGDEAAFSKNRRAEFEITGGGSSLVAPRP